MFLIKICYFIKEKLRDSDITLNISFHSHMFDERYVQYTFE